MKSEGSTFLGVEAGERPSDDISSFYLNGGRGRGRVAVHARARSLREVGKCAVASERARERAKGTVTAFSPSFETAEQEEIRPRLLLSLFITYWKPFLLYKAGCPIGKLKLEGS